MGLVFNPLDVSGGPAPAAPVSPITKSVVQALLAKHGGAAVAKPAAVPTPTIAPPDDSAPQPVSLSAAPMDSVPNAGTNLNEAVAASDGPTLKKSGLLDRVGDYLKSDDGRATMMRFAAGAFQGGLGGGLAAATKFADERRAQEAAAATEAQKLALEQTQIGNTYNLGLGKLGIDSETAGETARHNRATEGIQTYGINSTNARTNLEQGEKRFEHVTPSGDTQTTQAGENYRHDNVSGDTTATQQGENNRAVAANQKDITVAHINHAPPPETVHVHYTTTPGLFQSMHQQAVNAVRPSMVKPAAPAGQPARVNSDADYANLPSGATFIGPDGQTRVKP